jgi:hypothetical protein
MQLSFDHDVFISYAHIDNRALTEGQTGWIDQFHFALERRLSQLLGAESKLWRDPKLRGNDYFDDEITKKFPGTALLVSVISPRYIRSDSCLNELQAFCRAVQNTGGVRIENKSRLFKVVKTHVSREEHPRDLRELLGYEFYSIDANGRPREYMIDPRHETYTQFHLKLDDLAYDIRDMLRFLHSEQTPYNLSKPTTEAGPLYLAETTFDLQQERDQIRREFKPRGTSVLPDRQLPLTADSFKAAVEASLGQSNLSVHLIGENYGVIPEGEERSTVYLQNEIAAAVARVRPLKRIIWLPPDLQMKDPRQRTFVNEVRSQVANQAGVELIETSLEELKAVVINNLQPNRGKTTEPIERPGPITLYLIYDQRDADAVQPLSDYLFGLKYEVIPSLFEGEHNQLLQYHKDNLINADAAIIYYGRGSEFWARTKLNDLDKAFGYGRTKNWITRAVYVAGPSTSEKERFNTLKAVRIKNFTSFTPDLIEPFLQELRKPS